MITGKLKIRPRYGEVDQMGYVYHANYVSYCHQARTELLREYGINDRVLDKNGIMLPVIEMNLKYLQPAYYDDKLTIITSIRKAPTTRFYFDFEIFRKTHELICTATSTVVFVDKQSRKPMRIPDFIKKAIDYEFEQDKLIQTL